ADAGIQGGAIMPHAKTPPEWISGGTRRLEAANFSISADRAAQLPGVKPGAWSQILEAWELPDGWFGLLVAINGGESEELYAAEVRPNLDRLSDSEFEVDSDGMPPPEVEQLVVHTAVGSAKLLSNSEDWRRVGRRRLDIEQFVRCSIPESERWMIELVSCREFSGNRLGLRLRYTDSETVGEWNQLVTYRTFEATLKWEAEMPSFLDGDDVHDALVEMFVAAGECIGYELEHTRTVPRRLDLESFGAAWGAEAKADSGDQLAIARAYALSTTQVVVVVEVSSAASEPYRFLAVIDADQSNAETAYVRTPALPMEQLPLKVKQILASMVLQHASSFFFDGAALGYRPRTDLVGTTGIYNEVVWDADVSTELREVRAEILEAWDAGGGSTVYLFRLERSGEILGNALLRFERSGVGAAASHSLHLPHRMRAGGSEHMAIKAAHTRVVRQTLREAEDRPRRERSEFVNITIEVPRDSLDDSVVHVRSVSAVAFGNEELDVLVEVRSSDGEVRRELVTFLAFKYLPAGEAPCAVVAHTTDLSEREFEAVKALGLQISDALRESGDWSW
ncbi:MAG: hypothetical protein KDD66_00040, partial [Bdellovibrionales bacterium]|nr:hypothetical protein [Bdellovibrionales bacterium]